MAGFLSKLLTLGEGKQLKRYEATVERINGLESGMQEKSDDELRALTAAFKERVAGGEDLDAILPEAFAAVREASVRTTGLRHFDVQLIGGMALNDGQIAEMKTGEGKTLVSTLAGYLNALSGNNVHIVTVNDYLARRDSEWMGQIYRFLGMDVGLIQNGMKPDRKIPAYLADVTYGTNSEFGFDYLRDNMVTRAASRVQRGHHFAIVDEVDSILIDEARTPLIISGAGTQAAETYNKFARIMPRLRLDEDYDMDEAKKTINATESGLEKIEAMLGIDDLYADPSGQLANHLQQALKAEFLFHRDVDYVVVNGEVKIVDEFTGRIMEGRRYSEGLHQALEAKEHVLVREENQTLATITLQNYFRLYEKLSGMTGTAMTEDAEFREIYKLPVVAIPPNRPVVRMDEDDLIYRTVDAKFNAVADDVAERHAAGQPCLIGTVSIESLRAPLAPARQARHQARDVEREEPRARGAHHRAGGPRGRRDHRHEHGRPRHRHPPWRQPRGHGRRPAARARVRPGPPFGRRGGIARRRRGRRGTRTGTHGRGSRLCPGRGQAGVRRRARRRDRSRRPHRHRHRAPRVATHRQPAARPFRPPGRPGHHPVLPVAGRRPHEAFRRQPHGLHRPHDGEDRHARGHAHSGRHGFQGHRRRAAPGGEHALRRPQERAGIRRRHEPAARGHLRRAQRHPGRQGPRRPHPRDHTRGGGRGGGRELPREEPERRLGRQGGGPVGGEHDRPERLRCRRDRPRRRPGTACRRALRLPAGRVRGEVRHAGRGGRAQPGSPGDAAHHRHALDGAPPGDGLPEGGHRPARVRPARPLGGIQERGVQRLPEPDGVHVRGLPAHAFAPAGGRSEAARGREGPAVGPCAATRRPKRR